jgi:hypothetical protein
MGLLQGWCGWEGEIREVTAEAEGCVYGGGYYLGHSGFRV